jgi:hypothetical protein
MNIVPEATFQTKFNQVNHEFEIYLDSGAGQSDNNRQPINPNSIVNLTIDDTLSNWVVQGTLSIFYTPDTNNGHINSTTGADKTAKTGINENSARTSFNFRNDGNDLLRIRIKPKLDSNSENPDINTNQSHWTLSYQFVVYDMEDIDLPPGAQNQAAASIKCLKLYFWDEWYQKMITNVMEYSTAQSSEFTQNVSNGEYANAAVIETGRAIKEIIEKALKDVDSADGAPCGSEVADSSGFADWELGPAKIFYTAPAQSTAYDSLMYVYDRHISEVAGEQLNVNDFSILMKDRDSADPTSVGRFTLKPVTSFFQKAGAGADSPGEYQFEHFFLQGYSGEPRPTKFMRGPQNNTSSGPIDFKSLKYGTITNYRFVDIAALTNSNLFTNSPVYSFDFKNRTFNVEFKNNSVLTAKKFMTDKYIKGVYKSEKSSPEKLFLINLDEDKKAKNTRPAFSLHGDDPLIRQHAGLQKLLRVGLFQNAAINFRTLGLTFREPGRFIAIDRTEGVEQGEFEEKFYGQWFVLNVKHIFESEFYYNDITAIKIHRFQDMGTTFPGLLKES